MTDAQIRQAATSEIARFTVGTFMYDKFVVVMHSDSNGIVVAANKQNCGWRLEYAITGNTIHWVRVDVFGFQSVVVE